MATHISDERNELQEDDEKLQAALHEFVDQWDEDDDDYSEEDEDQLLIDLDYENSEQTVNSASSSFVGSATQSRSFTAADDESQDVVPRPDIQLPTQVGVAEESADPWKTLNLNRALQDILNTHIESILEALRENKEKQAKLEEDSVDNSSKAVPKSTSAGPFRAPYFRQGNSYPEPNEDVLQKKRSADYDAVKVEFMKDLRYPKKGARTILKDAVLEDQLERLLKPIVTQMEAEIKKRDKAIEEFDAMECSFESEVKRLKELQSQPQDSSAELMVKEVKKTIRVLEKAVEEKRKLIEEHKEIVTRLEQEIEQKRSTPVEELLAAVEIDKVDWMKIAKQNFDNYTWLDCQKAWENLVSPTVNNASWTKEEDEKLLNLVKNSETWDWQKTAKELGRGRTPFQCFSRYQQRFNPDLKPRPWTEEEDAKLIKVTTNVKDSVGFFSWAKVSALIDSRSPLECMSRFTRVDPSQSRGRWTSLEDAKLIAAVEMIGPCWAKISKFIGSRNMVQCRDRYINCLAPNINFSHFTYDEDIKLLRLYKANGPAWSKMIPEFIGRTDSMIMGRFRQLKKWKQQNEWFNRQSDATKRMLLGKSLTVAERQKFLSKTTDYLHQQLGVIPEDYKRQELDRQNGVDPDIIPPRPPRHLRCYAFGGSKRDGGLNKWQKKLELHKRLTENLHRLLEKEIEATSNKGKKGGKSGTKLSEEVAQEIMNESVAATLRDQNNVRKLVRKKGKGQVKKLEAALNKAFLHAGTISVQELLQSSMADKKKMEPIEKYIRVESELKSILRRRGRTLSKLGRARRFFERDTRPVKVIEDELDELDISVPLMLMKGFGSDIHYLHNAARLRSLQIHEELSEQPAYEEDEDFQQEEANVQEAIQKVLARTDITDSYRQHQISILNSKLKSLRKIHKEKRFLNSKVIENKINTFQDDLDYLESLADEKREMEVNKNLALMACNPQGSLGTEFDSEMEVFSTPVGSDNTRSSDNPSSSQDQSSSGHQSELGRDEASSTVENSVFAVPALPGEKKRKRFSTRILSNTSAGEKSFQKKFRALTKEEIAQEKRKISTVRKKVYTKLPFLPPNLSTLLSLRALLLMKQKLIDRAGLLYKPECCSRRPRLEIDIAEEDESVGINLREENQTASSGSWFLNTHPQQLAEQARQFKGFVSHRGNQRSSAADEPEFDLPTERIRYGRKHRPDHSAVSFESDTLVFPLEERGGAVSSKRKTSHNSEADSKPVILEPTHASEYTNAQSKSCYEVVMSYAGDYSINAPPAKEMSKGLRLAQTTAPRLNKTAAVGKYDDTPEASEDSICIVPSTTIKTDEGTPLVSGSRIVNKGSSEIASESHREGVMQKVIDVPSVSETKHIVRCEEDDDVVAVIHLDDDEDDDFGHARTVIDLRESYSGSRAPANTGGRNIVDSDDDETSMFTLSVQPQKASQLSELTRMELPEGRVNRIMRNHRLRDRKSDVVLVDIDKDSKSIIHFKSNKDKFTAYEAVSTNTAETRVGHQRRVYTNEDEKEKFIPDYMSVLRQTKEYKMLLARFHALFMWPVLISTIEPSPLNDGSLPTMLNTYSAWLEQNSRKRPRRKKRIRTKRSLIMRKHLQNIRDSSLEARRKRFLDQMAQELGEPAENVDEGAEMAERGDADANVTDVTTQDDENDDEANEEAKPSAVSEEVKKRKVRRKRKVKPIRIRDKKYDEILRKKSRPVIEADQEGLQPEEAGSKVLPQWWRDAVLAAMVAKKTMADDGEEDTVVNIEEDEDFIDKGNYSDDEWYQELRTEEDKKNVKGRRKKRTVSNSQEGQRVVEDSTAGHDL